MGGGESVIASVPTGHTLPLIIVILESQSLLGVSQGKPQARGQALDFQHSK